MFSVLVGVSLLSHNSHGIQRNMTDAVVLLQQSSMLS